MGLFKKKNQRRWEQMAALGDARGMTGLGFLAQEAGDMSTARDWYEQAAALGDADAMVFLGFLVKEAGDKAGARAWWKKAAALGHPGAIETLSADLASVDLTNVTGMTRAEALDRVANRVGVAPLDLSGADLTGADLTDADLSSANLLGADLTGAKLFGA